MHYLIYFLIFYMTFTWLWRGVGAYEFCADGKEQELCSDNRHIVCFPEQVGMDGTYLAHFPMTAKLKRTILEQHNNYRNEIAGGTETGGGGNGSACTFPPAVRLRELIWDNELAYTAHVHAGRCKMEHDKCRNTRLFSMAGQNLAYMSSSEKLAPIKLLKDLMDMWYYEKNLVTDCTKAAESVAYGFDIGAGHWTALMNDYTSRLGCAMSYCTNCYGLKHCYYLTCNYDMTNVPSMPLYQHGEDAGTKCYDFKASESSDYPNLCENTGEIFKLDKYN